MKIGIQTWGSHGDIRPIIALAQGLQAAGKAVHLVLTCVDSGDYTSIVPANGLRVTVLASPVLSPAQQEDSARQAYAARDPFKQMSTIMRQCFAPVEDVMFDAAQALAAESDVLIGHFFMHPLQIAAEAAGKPYVSVMLSIVGIESDFNHPLGLPGLGRIGHRLLWTLTRTLLNRVFLSYPNRLRLRLGMPRTHDLLREVWLAQALTLVAVSPQLCRAQPDWPAPLRICGFFDAPGLAIDGALPDALDAFLAAGEAPVYMTFGSWMPKDAVGQNDALTLLTQAARLAGCRAIIQSHSARDCGFTSDEQILYIAAAPHHAVFPHCRAVVHHGGAGTTQSATLAGKPSIVVAHIGEQEHWGLELRRAGIAGRPLKRRKTTAAVLAKRIGQVLASPAMAARAEEVGAAMSKENGVAEAVRLVMARFGAGRRQTAQAESMQGGSAAAAASA